MENNQPETATQETSSFNAASNSPARLDGETMEQYKLRRKFNAQLNKQATRKVNMLWDASRKGTYRTKKHGPLSDL